MSNRLFLLVSLFVIYSMPAYSYTEGILTSDLVGFHASDWSTDGTALYVAKGRHIYKSINATKGSTSVNFTLWYSLPEADLANAIWYEGQTCSLTIPNRYGSETTDRMLVSVWGSNKLYMCEDISQETPSFNAVIDHPHTESFGFKTDGGPLQAVAEDSSGNLYCGWYHTEPGNGAHLYKSTNRGTSWIMIQDFEARHIHNIRVNPNNNYLYVLTGEEGLVADADDMNSVFRSTDGGSTFVRVRDGAGDNTRNFLAMDFIPNSSMIILGQEVVAAAYTDPANGSIFSFTDSGTPPFEESLAFAGASNRESWMFTTRMGSDLFLTSCIATPFNGSVTVRSLSTTDGANFTAMRSTTATTTNSTAGDAVMGQLTTHPGRAGRAVYALNTSTAYYVDGDIDVPTPPISSNLTISNGGIR